MEIVYISKWKRAPTCTSAMVWKYYSNILLLWDFCVCWNKQNINCIRFLAEFTPKLKFSSSLQSVTSFSGRLASFFFWGFYILLTILATNCKKNMEKLGTYCFVLFLPLSSFGWSLPLICKKLVRKKGRPCFNESIQPWLWT